MLTPKNRKIKSKKESITKTSRMNAAKKSIVRPKKRVEKKARLNMPRNLKEAKKLQVSQVSNPAFVQVALLENRSIASGANVPFSFISRNNGFTFDSLARSLTANVEGEYWISYNLWVVGSAGAGAAFSIRINGTEQTSSIYGVDTTEGNDVRLNGCVLVRLTRGDVITLSNTGNNTVNFRSNADGQIAMVSASLIAIKIAE